MIEIEEKIPLKQGLKRYVLLSFVSILEDWREDSIKTRIETKKINTKYIVTPDWREDSIKTRIETNYALWYVQAGSNWREDSIKTRIETMYLLGRKEWWKYWREDSIKTRIETCRYIINYYPKSGIEEKIPLKQGLKRLCLLLLP